MDIRRGYGLFCWKDYPDSAYVFSCQRSIARKLYEYARAGEKSDVPNAKFTYIVLNVPAKLSWQMTVCVCIEFVVERHLCRTLVDLGAKLGYASHMSKLERTGSAGMDLTDALTLEEFLRW